MPRKRRKHAPKSAEWAYVADVAAALRRQGEGCSRWTAREVLLKVRAVLGDDVAQKVRRAGRPMWRVRAQALARYLELRKRALPDRLAALEARLADLEERLEEAERRADRHADELRALRAYR